MRTVTVNVFVRVAVPFVMRAVSVTFTAPLAGVVTTPVLLTTAGFDDVQLMTALRAAVVGSVRLPVTAVVAPRLSSL